jgi:hypothetical protein
VLELGMCRHDAIRLAEPERFRARRKDPRVSGNRAARHHGMDLQRESGSLPQAGLTAVHRRVFRLKAQLEME